MADKMKVDVWSDVACPYCYIGKRHLEQALAEFPHKNDVEVVFHSYELNPDQKQNAGTFPEEIEKKYGVDSDKAKETINDLETRAKDCDLPLNLNKAQVTNTFDAHRLLKYAKTVSPQKETELMNQLYADYFVKGLNVSDAKVLLDAAKTVGLDENKIKEILKNDDDTFGKEVRTDEMEAQSMGLTSVPFYVFNREYAVSGAQSVKVFTAALDKAWNSFSPKSNGLKEVGNGDVSGEACENGACHLDKE